MSINKLVALARVDSPTLAWLCKTWIEQQRCVNPVLIARRIVIMRIFLALELLALILLVGLAAHFAFHISDSRAIVIAISGFALGVAVLMIPTMKEINGEYREEVDRFCEAISLLEEQCGPLSRRVVETAWDIRYDPESGTFDANTDKLIAAAEAVLCMEARKTKSAEGYPWKEAERIAQRQIFSRKMDLLTGLLRARFDTKSIFK